MHYVYLLKSDKNQDLYIGYTDDLKKRFKEHNGGRVKYTKSYKPWQLIYYEAYKNQKDATKREYQLKKHCFKDELRKKLQFSLK